MAQTTINQRLNLIVDTFEKGKKASFARKAGISPQGAQEILAGRKGDPSFKVLIKILESYPQIQTEWLVHGRGDMLYQDVPEEPAAMNPKEAASLALSDTRFLDEHRNMIEQVKKTAEEVVELRDYLAALAESVSHMPRIVFGKGSGVDNALKWLPKELPPKFRDRASGSAKPIKSVGKGKTNGEDK